MLIFFVYICSMVLSAAIPNPLIAAGISGPFRSASVVAGLGTGFHATYSGPFIKTGLHFNGPVSVNGVYGVNGRMINGNNGYYHR
jgi:hypothetical protein